MGNDSVAFERKMTLLKGELPSLKTTVTYKPDTTFLKDSKIPKDDKVTKKKL